MALSSAQGASVSDAWTRGLGRAPVLVETIETLEALDAVAKEWAQLWARARSGPFQSFAFVREWAARYAQERGRRLRVVVLLNHHKRVLAIAPFAIASTPFGGIVEFAGEPLIQVGDVLLDESADTEVLGQALGCEIRRWRDVRGFWLRRVRASACIHKLLDPAPQPDGEPVPAPVFILDANSPPEPRSRNLRKSLQRRKMKLKSRAEVVFEAHGPGATARELCVVALAWKRTWLEATGRVSRLLDLRTEETLLALVARADAEVHVFCLKLDGRPIAVEIGFQSFEKFVSFLGAADPEFAPYGPGHLLIEKVLIHIREAGMSQYDFLAPPDEYKLQWTANSEAQRDYVFPTDTIGCLTMRMVPTLRIAMLEIFSRLPKPVRQQIAKRIGG